MEQSNLERLLQHLVDHGDWGSWKSGKVLLQNLLKEARRSVMTPEDMAKLIATLLNYSPNLTDSNYKAVIEEIREYGEAEYERGCRAHG